MKALLESLRKFNEDRNWPQYHSPKNLSTSILIEAAELAEVFQWLTEEESRNLSAVDRKRAEEEIADVFLYLLNLSDKLDIDIISAAHSKMVLNGKKYPVSECYGSREKYNILKAKKRKEQ